MRDYQLRPDRDLTILVPARAGSKRVPGKNTRLLSGKPLIQWTLEAAKQTDCRVIVSSDDPVVKELALAHHCDWAPRRPEHATDDAPDFLWVEDLWLRIRTPYFAICRPTSPFRTAATIRRCYAAFMGSNADSIRAVSRVTSPHPGKMWKLEGKLMVPVWKGAIGDTPYHSCPTQVLPEVFVQNASLEMAHTAVIQNTQTISGLRVAPFFTDPVESLNIDTEADFAEAERIASDSTWSGR